LKPSWWIQSQLDTNPKLKEPLELSAVAASFTFGKAVADTDYWFPTDGWFEKSGQKALDANGNCALTIYEEKNKALIP
jgi:hypothetical protein